MTASKSRRRGGFSLLETVVAMAVFAAAGSALFALFNTNLIALARVEDTSTQVAAVRSALARLSAVNPAVRQAGRFNVGDHDITWEAALVEPARPGNSLAGVPAMYQLGLYEIVFDVKRGARTLGTWRVRQVGYSNNMPGAGLAQ